MSSTAYDDTIKKLCSSDIERVEITNMDTDQDGGNVEDEDRTLNNKISKLLEHINRVIYPVLSFVTSEVLNSSRFRFTQIT